MPGRDKRWMFETDLRVDRLAAFAFAIAGVVIAVTSGPWWAAPALCGFALAYGLVSIAMDKHMLRSYDKHGPDDWRFSWAAAWRRISGRRLRRAPDARG